MIYSTSYQERRVGEGVLDGDWARAWREYWEMTAQNELMGRSGGTFHLREKALRGLNSIRVTRQGENGSLQFWRLMAEQQSGWLE